MTLLPTRYLEGKRDRSGAVPLSTITSLFSGAWLPQLFRPRYYAAISPLSQSTEGRFDTPRIKFRVTLYPVTFVQDNDSTGPDSSHDPRGYLPRIAPDCVE